MMDGKEQVFVKVSKSGFRRNPCKSKLRTCNA
jgi:hypothetical protein